MDITLYKLDKIIWLLEKIAEQKWPEKDFNRKLTPEEVRQEYYPFFEPDKFMNDGTTNTDPICNCHLHRPGESTGGWFCSLHGQRF